MARSSLGLISLFLPRSKRILTGLGMSLLSLTTLPAQGTAQEPSDTMVESSSIPLDRLYASPSLSGPRPQGLKFSPDGQTLAFIKARDTDAARFDLWQIDLATGAQSLLVDSTLLEPDEVELSEEEKAMRERKRIAGRKGIVSYDWGASDTLLVPLGGDLYRVTLTEADPQIDQLTETDAFEYDARFSPDGRYVSFIRDGALIALDVKTGDETALSPPADPEAAISYGVAEFVAQEEMSRFTGYWWHPDTSHIAYTKVDESTVDIIPRFDIAADEVTVVNQRYPRTGRPNALASLFVRNMDTGETRDVAQFGPDDYLARVNWAGDTLWVQSVNRDQTALTHSRATGPDWSLTPHFVEQHKTWINLSHDFLKRDTGEILSTAEVTSPSGESAYRAVISLSDEGAIRAQGDWEISALKGVDSASGDLFVTGYGDTVLEHHLYRVSASTGTFTRLTEAGSSWTVSLSPSKDTFIGVSSNPQTPPQTGLYDISGERIAWIEENALTDAHPYAPYRAGHTLPTFGTLEAEDGQSLHYSMQTPPDFDPAKTYPVLVEVYGGPHAQLVDRDWERLTDIFYTQQGYIVFRLDNRGSAHRGKRFEDTIYRRTGGPEVRDQLRGVEWLKAQPFVDPNRIAIQGWSYGGYMTLMTIAQAPEGTFAAAVAGAPVTDWSLYDTFYTERYMDTPLDNAEGYHLSSVFAHIDGISTPLLLVHGMADDNVTFDNSTRLMAELQERGIPFELMTYPGQRHGIQGEELRKHLMQTRLAFLARHLKETAR